MMLTGICVVLTAIPALLLGRAFRDRLPTVGKGFAIVLIAVVVAGAALMAVSVPALTRALAVRGWPTVTGTVTAAEVTATREHQPVLRFSYEIRGRKYAGTSNLNHPGFGSRARRRDAASSVVAPYEPGDELRLYYNPEDPAEAKIKPGPAWDVYGKIGFGATLIAIAALFLGAAVPGREPRDTPIDHVA